MPHEAARPAHTHTCLKPCWLTWLTQGASTIGDLHLAHLGMSCILITHSLKLALAHLGMPLGGSAMERCEGEAGSTPGLVMSPPVWELRLSVVAASA